MTAMYLNLEPVQPCTNAPTLPGQPAIALSDSQKVLEFVSRDIVPRDLNRIALRLWWMSRWNKENVSPLHRQRVKNRQIILTEEAKLHLVWAYKIIYIKPLPRYLLSKPFWDTYLCQPSNQPACEAFAQVRSAAFGLIRSYAYLVHHESDFNIAIDLQLLPPDTKWDDFARYLSAMRAIADEHCSPRYAYGEIRLTRLNFYAPILLRRRYYHRTEYHYSGYFAAFYGPCLFVIGLSTVILTALQLTVQVDIEAAARNASADDSSPVSDPENATITAENSLLKSFCRFVGYSSVAISSVAAVYLMVLLLAKFGREWHYAIRERVRRREEVLRERDRLRAKGSRMTSDAGDVSRLPLYHVKSAME
ncbi:hypothetical protein Micbo1qcDRAFT_198746 [Microdochium bolleyi]|uniref:Uncharacterized protein n=1 Tax=Microdochium bolleyi TaxID=196109 RepID=A0A136IL59_9PEZI|nr:hypothetical protein Micbo1qcDRAFT_198746 [Microdochium bolleyi]